MMNLETQKESVTKAAKTVVDGTKTASTKAIDFSTDVATTAAGKAKELFARTKDLAGTGVDKVTAVKVGDKNVGERVDATVETVQSAVDVDQITGQVAKLREQIESVLENWKESFRPSHDDAKTPVAEAKAAAAKKPAAKKPATKATAKKPATKATAKKPAAKKPATKKPATKATNK
jgi:hypothetical protein